MRFDCRTKNRKTRREWHRVGDRERVRVTYRFVVRVRLGLRSGRIFRFISQTAYLIYQYSADSAEYKSHLGIFLLRSDFRSQWSH